MIFDTQSLYQKHQQMPVKTYEANNRIRVDTPYHEEFIAELKEKIDSPLRSWDKEEKEWVIHPEAQQTINKLVQKHFPPGHTETARKYPHAIDVKYNGHDYRSLTEARWGYLLNYLLEENQWFYEPEVYYLDNHLYLPDFYVQDEDLFVEVKGKTPRSAEIEKAKRLSRKVARTAIFVGPPYNFDEEESILLVDGRVYEKASLSLLSRSGTRKGLLGKAVRKCKSHRFDDQ